MIGPVLELWAELTFGALVAEWAVRGGKRPSLNLALTLGGWGTVLAFLILMGAHGA